jgi:iron only hydrogenase large subunit-like protein
MSSVFLTHVDDYLETSQACVNPLFTSGAGTTTSGETKKATAETGQKGSAKLDLGNANDAMMIGNGSGEIGPSTSLGLSKGPSKPKPRRKRPQITVVAATVESSQSATSMVEPDLIQTSAGADGNKKATVSVADCLACSGCVTSAEAVLVNQHSLPTLQKNCGGSYGTYGTFSREDNLDLNLIRNVNRRHTAFTISPAVLVDLVRLLDMDKDKKSCGGDRNHSITAASRVFMKIVTLLHHTLGADLVTDGQSVGDISLLESAREFVYRYRNHHHHNDKTTTADKTTDTKDKTGHVSLPIACNSNITQDSMLPSIALSATKTRYIRQSLSPDLDAMEEEANATTETFEVTHLPGRIGHGVNNNDTYSDNGILPMMSSSCPGFVCYVEKTAPSAIPHLSTAKSQMAVAGYIIKHLLPLPIIETDDASLSMSSWYHVAIMPCHDKKLEASRKDLAWDSIMNVQTDGPDTHPLVPDVDLVITTSELLDLIHELAIKDSDSLEGGEGGSSDSNVIRRYFESIPLATMTQTSNADGPVTNSSTASTSLSSGTMGVKSCCVPPLVQGDVPSSTEIGTDTETPDMKHSSSSQVSVIVASSTCNNNNVNTTTSANTMMEWSTPTRTSSSGSSGGYADFMFRYAAQELFDVTLPLTEPLPWQNTTLSTVSMSTANASISTSTGSAAAAGRAHAQAQRRRRPARRADTRTIGDLREVTLYHDTLTGSFSTTKPGADDVQSSHLVPVLKFSTAYGFKNIQGILQQLKPSSKSSHINMVDHSNSNSKGRCDFHYVEVMACPSGCLNGGGQVRSLDSIVPSNDAMAATPRKEAPSEKRERVARGHLLLDSRLVSGPTTTTCGTSSIVPAADDNNVIVTVENETVHSVYQAISATTGTTNKGVVGSNEEEKAQMPGDGDEDGEMPCFSATAQNWLHTRYHAVPRLELTTGALSGVAVNHTKW